MTVRSTYWFVLGVAAASSLVACSRGPAATTPSTPSPATAPSPNKKTALNTFPSFKICTPQDECVDESTALQTLYRGLIPDESLETSGNMLVIQGSVLSSIVSSAYLLDASDQYAIFFVQELQLQSGHIIACHACIPKLGLVIFQYHNGWKLFARNPAVIDFGGWGMIQLTKATVDIVPEGTEKFLIALTSSDSGQGMTDNFVEMIGVTHDSASGAIRSYGVIDSGEQDCHNDPGHGEDWTAQLEYEKLDRFPPPVTVTKMYSKSCTDGAPITRRETVRYDIVGPEQKYAVVKAP
jgi:hypothetical protein